MKAQNIFIVRHGLSEGNLDHSLYERVPDWKINLAAEGIFQSAEVGATLSELLNVSSDERIDIDWANRIGVYLSPMYRARQTWAAMAPNFHSDVVKFVKEDPRLREQEWGNLMADKDSDQIEKDRAEYGPFFYRFLNGESGADVYDRCSMFLDTLYRDFESEEFPNNVIIVTHSFTMRALLMRWMHLTVEQFHDLPKPDNCEYYVLRLQENDKYKQII